MAFNILVEKTTNHKNKSRYIAQIAAGASPEKSHSASSGKSARKAIKKLLGSIKSEKFDLDAAAT